MIYTSYFGNLKKIPEEIVRVTICGGVPQWYDGLQYKKVAPKYGFFQEYKKNNDWGYYTDHYKSEVLDTLDIESVINDIKTLTNEAKDVVLLCYEKPDDNCHRHLFANWLEEHGVPCEEFSMERYMESEKNNEIDR